MSQASNLHQGGDSWHLWRREGLTSTSAAVVLGISQYQTEYQLYRWYLGLEPDPYVNAHMSRGTRLEPKARAFASFQLGLDFTPECMEWAENPIFRASLDGITDDKSAILEIKCPGQENHELNLKGVIQEYYKAQIQHQLLVSQAKVCHFVSFFEPEGTTSASVKIIEVKPDPAMQAEIVAKGLIFWDRVLKKTPPPLSDKDTLVLDSEPMLRDLEKLYDEHQQAKEAYETLRAEIITRLPHPRVKCGRVSISNNRVTITKEKA